MARLIDADILIGYIDKYDTGSPVGKALRAMIDKSPTVEAVPVSLIEEHIHSYNRQYNAARNANTPEDDEIAAKYDDMAWALKYVIQDWRERNGQK